MDTHPPASANDPAGADERLRRAEFLARVGHEMRTPLHGILGFAALALGEDAPAAVREQLRLIQRSAEGLRALIERMEELLRLDDGGVAPGGAPFEGSASAVEVPLAAAPAALRVLIAEDNPVNQMLAAALLRRDGHAVRVVGDGRAAFEALRDEPFDLVLMDVQMPLMDGYEATARIRALDASRGRRTPVIAITAQGDAADRRRCLAAGMDDFVGKPIDAAALRGVIARWCAVAPPAASRPPPSPSPGAAVDVPSLRARVGGRSDLLRKLVELFREQHPAQLAALRSALDRRDAAEARQVAHRLIGTLGCLSAPRAAEVARAVERASAEGDVEGAASRIDGLEREVRALDEALLRIAREGFGESDPR